MDRVSRATFLFWAVAGQARWLYLANSYSSRERDARLCIVPMLALLFIKYLFNPSNPHFWFLLTFELPFLLVFLPLQAFKVSLGQSLFSIIEYLSCRGGPRDLCFSRSRLCGWFNQVSSQLDRLIRAARMAHSRRGYQDSRACGADRTSVTAIREECDQMNRSSFFRRSIHLLSFYVNPKSYCGHFDVLTNVVTTDNVWRYRNASIAGPTCWWFMTARW